MVVPSASIVFDRIRCFPRFADECECDPERIPLEVGSPRPPSSSPDFIGSDSSSPPDPSQHPDILLSLCGGLKGNRVSVQTEISARSSRGLVWFESLAVWFARP